MAIASIVWHELMYGHARMPDSKKRRVVATYLDDVVSASLPILSYDARAATWHAVERARLTSSGMTPPFVDGQIAAIAAVHDLTLVTANISDFENFKGLQLENWSKE
jgi:tRNA(fMet)-specific endonuclease VapC